MGIYDRDYNAAPPPRRGLSVTTWIIIINCVVFVTTQFPILNGLGLPSFRGFEWFTPAPGRVVEAKDWHVYQQGGSGTPASSKFRGRFGNGVARDMVDAETRSEVRGQAIYEVYPPAYALGYFSTYMGFRRFEVWRLITFQFLHAGFLHIFFNMLGLWMLGRPVEEHLGGRKYLAFYLMCGICGGLMYLLLNGLGAAFQAMHWPKIPGLLFEDTATPLVGASAGVFGVIMACAYLAPNSIVQMIFPPISLRMRTFAYVYVAIAAVSLFIGTGNAGGEAAHIGGAIAGFFFIRNIHLLRDFFDVFGDSRRRGGGKKPIFRTSEAEKDAAFQLVVDGILAKVRAQGLASLTDKERKILEEATRRER